MFLIKTETRELKIDNGNGEKYFDAILKMMLDERKPTTEGGIQKETVKAVSIGGKAESEEEKEGYKGFLHLECSRCGRTRSFFAKDKLRVHRCCDCGKETELKEVRRAYLSCSGCDTDVYYLTNSTADSLRISCFKCGTDVKLKWNPEKGCYETIEGE